MSDKPLEGVIAKDTFDRRFVADLLEKPKVKEIVEGEDAQAKGVPDLGSLFGDVWASLFKAVPRMKDADECVGSEYVHRKMMEHALGTEAFNRLRKFTVLDTRASSLGAIEFMRQFDVPEDVRKSLDDVKQAEEALKQAIDADDRQGIEDAGKALAEAQTQFDQAMEDGQFDVIGAVVKAAKQASEVAEATRAAARVLDFGSDAGDEMMQDPGAAMALMDRLKSDRELMAILQMAGRLLPIALATLRNRTRKASDVVVSVKNGDDLRRLLPHELAAFADADRELDFLRRYAEAELLEYDLIGNMPEGKGPIVIAKDESGSMKGAPHIWATALSLAIAQACQKEKRDFCVIHFGSESEIKVDYFTHGEKRSLLEMASHFFNGGTSFDRPLTEAVEIATRNPDVKKADVVFITDGVCRVGRDCEDLVHKAKSATGMRLISIGVNGGNVDSLSRVSDMAVTLGFDEEGAVALINAVLDG